jgi:hypothetical protein
MKRIAGCSQFGWEKGVKNIALSKELGVKRYRALS